MSKKENPLFSIYKIMNDAVSTINNSKIFAGIILIIINVCSKFVTFKFSPIMEAYLKYTFSKNVLIFSVVWIGTRDIYISIIITLLFIVASNYLFNEESDLCCLSESFTSYHLSLIENDKVSEADIKKALGVLEKAKKQNDPNVIGQLKIDSLISSYGFYE